MITIQFKDFDDVKKFARQILGEVPGEGCTCSREPETAKTDLPAAPSQPTPITSQPIPAPVAPAIPSPMPVPKAVPPQASVSTMPQAVPVPQVVPTAPQTYTPDDLARAGVSLLNMGKQKDLLELLSRFGVTSVPELKPEQYGGFATALRGLGAMI